MTLTSRDISNLIDSTAERLNRLEAEMAPTRGEQRAAYVAEIGELHTLLVRLCAEERALRRVEVWAA